MTIGRSVDILSLGLVVLKLSYSLKGVMSDNLGQAREALKMALTGYETTKVADFDLALFEYIKGVLKAGKLEFLQEAIGIVVAELGDEYGQLLSPFTTALEYMQTKDVSILEQCQVELREIVAEIVDYANVEVSNGHVGSDN